MTLDDLIAREAIRDLAMQYCRAVDRRDYNSLAELYHEDAYDDHGEYFRGSAEDYVKWLPTVLKTNLQTSHQIFNHLIRIDGDYAEGEVYLQAYHLISNESGELTDFITGGRYLDKYERRNGVWKFTHRKIVADWNAVRPSQCTWDMMKDSDTPMGSHGKDDPSVGFFKLI